MTTDLSPDDLAAIRARAEAATDGPWIPHDLSDTQFNSTDGRGWWWVWQESKLPYYGGVMEVGDSGDPPGAIGNANITDSERGAQEHADATFIAAARTDVPALLARVEQLQGERDALQGGVARVREVCAAAEAHPGSYAFSLFMDDDEDDAPRTALIGTRAILAALDGPAAGGER